METVRNIITLSVLHKTVMQGNLFPGIVNRSLNCVTLGVQTVEQTRSSISSDLICKNGGWKEFKSY